MILDTLIFAWFLTLFDLDKTLTKAINEVFEKKYSTSVYWLVAFITGVALSIVELLFQN